VDVALELAQLRAWKNFEYDFFKSLDSFDQIARNTDVNDSVSEDSEGSKKHTLENLNALENTLANVDRLVRGLRLLKAPMVKACQEMRSALQEREGKREQLHSGRKLSGNVSLHCMESRTYNR
jgi:hypothetical protein